MKYLPLAFLLFSTPVANVELRDIQVPQLSDNHSYLKDSRTPIIVEALEYYNVAPEGLVVPILQTANQYDLDPLLIVAILKQESDFRADVVSHAGAIGISQIMPFWARTRGFSPDKLYNVHTNINTCGYVLRHYLDRFKGNKFKAVRAYFGQCDAGTRYAKSIFNHYDTIIRM